VHRTARRRPWPAGFCPFVPAADASPSHRGHGRCARSAQTMCGAKWPCFPYAPIRARRGARPTTSRLPALTGQQPGAGGTRDAGSSPLDPSCSLPGRRPPSQKDQSRREFPAIRAASEAADQLQIRQTRSRMVVPTRADRPANERTSWPVRQEEGHVSAGQRPDGLMPPAVRADALFHARIVLELTCDCWLADAAVLYCCTQCSIRSN
jgi:hypothetical protein